MLTYLKSKFLIINFLIIKSYTILLIYFKFKNYNIQKTLIIKQDNKKHMDLFQNIIKQANKDSNTNQQSFISKKQQKKTKRNKNKSNLSEQNKIWTKNESEVNFQNQQQASRKAFTDGNDKKARQNDNENQNNLFQRKSRAQNLISQILDYEIYKLKNLNPEFLRIKNNILLIMLILASFGIYYLFQDFLDVMLLAFIGGVGYQQMRERFIKFWISDKPFFQKQMTIMVRIMSIFGYLIAIFLLPWLRNVLGHPQQIFNHLVFSDFVYSFSFKLNPVIFFVQIILMMKVLHLILAPKIFPIIAYYVPKSTKFYSYSFGLVFVIVSLLCISIIPSALVMQFSYGGFWIQQKVQEHLGCQVINYSSHNNTKLPFCSEKFFNNNTMLEQTFKQFKAQTSQIEDCMTSLFQLQKKFIGYQFFHYQQITCTWYLILQKASTYFTLDADVFATSTKFVKTVFGNIAFVIMSFSNIIFSVTTFITIFYMTVAYFDSRSNIMQQIFFGQRKELLGQITNLIQATLFIVIEHFILSLILLEIFNFSNFNLIIATLLSSMAFVPFFRPWFGVLFFCIIRSLFIGNVIINIIFVVIYRYSSQKIFSNRFQQMQFHEIITNLSILFGIYQFGIAGIFYGPIIMIVFRSVHRQLLRNQVYSQVNDSKKNI